MFGLLLHHVLQCLLKLVLLFLNYSQNMGHFLPVNIQHQGPFVRVPPQQGIFNFGPQYLNTVFIQIEAPSAKTKFCGLPLSKKN